MCKISLVKRDMDDTVYMNLIVVFASAFFLLSGRVC